jgi:hypothetical protein
LDQTAMVARLRDRASPFNAMSTQRDANMWITPHRDLLYDVI